MILRIVSVSGGKDSTALYLWAIEQWGKDGFRAVFADTGHEHPVTYNYLRNLPTMANGPEIEWVKSDFSKKLKQKGIDIPAEGMLALWLWKGRAPSARAQFCTEHLKLRPILDWLTIHRGTKEVEMYVGIRAAESARRAKMPMEEDSDFYDCIVKRPLLKWSEEAVFAYLKLKGVEPNPLYDHGSARVGCYPCVHSRKSELANMEDWAWEKLAVWEKLAGTTWFSFGEIPLTQEQTLELKKAEHWETVKCIECCGSGTVVADFGPAGSEIYDCPDCLGEGLLKRLTNESSLAIAKLKDKFSPSVKQVREWTKTSRGGRQFQMFQEDAKDVPSCMSTWGACE